MYCIVLLSADQSDTQQELCDINQRFDAIGEKLAERQRHLADTRDKVDSYRHDLSEQSQWLDEREQLAPPVGNALPMTEDDATRRLQEQEVRSGV